MSGRMARLWRSMPLRLALLLVMLFSTVSLLSLAASYAVTQASFEQAIRADLAQDMAGFRAAPSARAVAFLVEAESRATDPNRSILSYVTPGGVVYGNGAIARDDEGYHIITLRDAPGDYAGDYLTLTDTLHGGLLTVARSRAEIEALRAGFVNILWISLLPTILIALSGGLVIARRSKRDVEVIGRTLDSLTAGDLSARARIDPRWSDDLRSIGGKLNLMAGAQQHSVEALRQVSSDIAHDLKTPIQRVAVHLDDLERVVPPEGETRELVERAQAEVNGIATVFQSLLQLAQVDSGSPRQRFAPVDLNTLCATMAEVYEPAAQAAGKTLTLHLPDDVLSVEGDRALLGQALANLIENGLRHTPEGARVEVTLERQPEGFGPQGATAPQLVVADDGPGIPEAERDKVLRRLYRLDSSRNTPGNGLGLALVDSIVKLHGAELRLTDNSPGLRAEIRF